MRDSPPECSVDLSEAQLQGAEFKYALLQGANLPRTELQGADFRWLALTTRLNIFVWILP